MYRKIGKVFNFRVVRYGVVGLTSTAIHIIAASLFIYFIDQSLLLSNIFGFSWAYLFSYIAQSKLVFTSKLSLSKSLKYLCVQLACLMIAIALADHVEAISIYLKVLLTAIILPIITFFIHKTWTFREQEINSGVTMYRLLGPYVLGLVIITVFIRIYGMLEFPLHDPTEARYAEIPRLILETGQWIMPPFNYDVPFWGKPPLTFWLTALSFKLFGINDFTARIPVFLLTCFLLWLTFHVARKMQTGDKAWMGIVILITTPLFFIASGAVMTDMVLTLCVSLSMISFWVAVNDDKVTVSKKWAYLFFVGLGLGLLVKGPIVGILVMLPIFAWVAITRQWQTAWQKLPWLTGTVLMLLIAVPWYVLAEIESPGFIDYFLVGEHFKRFVDNGWQGDLYGDAHSAFRGEIWLLWLVACLPWSFIYLGCLLSWPFRKNKDISLKKYYIEPWHLYLLLWAITPMMFFTLSQNILYTYVLPGMPAFALMTTDMLCVRFDIKSALKSKWLITGCITPIAALVLFLMDPAKISFEKNQKHLVNLYKKTRVADDSGLYYLHERLFSVDFYTQGKVGQLDFSHQQFYDLLMNDKEDFVIMQDKHIIAFAPDIQQAFKPVGKYRYYLLLKESTGQ